MAKLGRMVSVSFTQEQYEALAAIAKGEGRKVSNAIRYATLQFYKIDPGVEEEDDEVEGEE